MREIGLRSLSTDLGLDIFGAGITSADLRVSGCNLVQCLALKMEHIGPASNGAADFSTQLGISSGPIAF